jgi:hypothetical protein
LDDSDPAGTVHDVYRSGTVVGGRIGPNQVCDSIPGEVDWRKALAIIRACSVQRRHHCEAS